MLQYLTNDLLFLKVTSQLHHLSIQGAIHVLHVTSSPQHASKERPETRIRHRSEPRKMGFSSFGHRKKRTDDSTDYICPLDASQAQALLNGANRPYSGFRGLSPIFDRDPQRREQVGDLQI
ncbi:hypothetical protein cypCar_00023363 [Cyprinus carpio]|nr:hypothetical protein cypCar_00023363 [Cyprinus carpio]